MRHVLFSLGVLVSAGIVVTSPAPIAAVGAADARLDDLAWMAGSWSSDEGGKRSEEHWTAPAGGMMLGLHRDVAKGKTAFEFLRIEEIAGKPTYLASPQGREATPFTLIESGQQRAVFANPEHDFPQRILYWREGRSLCAAVEGPMNGEDVSERWCWAPAALK